MKRIFALFVLTFVFAGYAFAECGEADKKALEAFDRAWGEAGVKGDRSALTAIYADDYTGLPGMENKTKTIEDTMAQFEADKKNPPPEYKLTHDNYMITCTPGSAVITHRNVYAGKNPASGKEEEVWSRSVHFLEKRGGKWQVVGNSGNNLDEYAILGYMERDWNNAYIKRDMSWFEKNFAADYSNVSSGTGKFYTKAAEIAEYKTDKSVTESADLSEMNIRIDGNTAIVTLVNHIKGRDDKGQPFELRVRNTDTFIKRDGRWQVWATQGTRIP